MRPRGQTRATLGSRAGVDERLCPLHVHTNPRDRRTLLRNTDTVTPAQAQSGRSHGPQRLNAAQEAANRAEGSGRRARPRTLIPGALPRWGADGHARCSAVTYRPAREWGCCLSGPQGSAGCASFKSRCHGVNRSHAPSRVTISKGAEASLTEMDQGDGPRVFLQAAES